MKKRAAFCLIIATLFILPVHASFASFTPKATKLPAVDLMKSEQKQTICRDLAMAGYNSCFGLAYPFSETCAAQWMGLYRGCSKY